jgi:DNA-directed RNA polymerase specialized sigma24 family protein
MPMSRSEFERFHRAQLPRLRRILALDRWRLQPADQASVAQDVWLKVLTRWPEKPPENERAYLTTIIVNAIREHYRKNHLKKNDERANVAIIDEGDSGPIDCQLVDSVNVSEDVDVLRLRERFEEIAALLKPADADVFRRMMVDVDEVPKRDRDRVVKAVRVLLKLSARPRSVEHPDREGPSHCGRALRRIKEEQRADAANDDNWDEPTEELDAAE